MLYVWNGKKAEPAVKAMAMSRGFELDILLAKAKDQVLQVFFAGGVIRAKKLQRGNIYVFDDIIEDKNDNLILRNGKDNPNAPSAVEVLQVYEKVYLYKWLFPDQRF